MKMRLEIPDKVNHSCHVFRLGWTYPICIWNKSQFTEAKSILTPTFGKPANRWYFNSYSASDTPTVNSSYLAARDKPLEARWFADTRLWKKKSHYPKYDFWIVFQTEKDRTLAMMLLG